ncbi:MAG: ABC transporter permease subunit [Isosphaeraceae bacterium]
MNLPSSLRVVGWLVRDTFRQSLQTRAFWMLLGLSALVIATCLSVGVEGSATLHRPGENADFLPRVDPEAASPKAKRDGVDVPSGTLTLAFGAFRVPLARDARDAVLGIQFVLASAVAGTAGLLLALIWTAGFMPGFLAPRSASLLLVRPAPRPLLFLGKCAGVLMFVMFQTTVLVGGSWLALGARTGVWDAGYLVCIPLVAAEFAVFYSVSALIAADLRGTTACVLGALLFWLICWGMNYGRHAVAAAPGTAPGVASTAPWLNATVEAGYWVLPKPADFGIVLADSLGSTRSLSLAPEFDEVKRARRFHPALSLLSSLAASAVILALAVRRFAAADY